MWKPRPAQWRVIWVITVIVLGLWLYTADWEAARRGRINPWLFSGATRNAGLVMMIESKVEARRAIKARAATAAIVVAGLIVWQVRANRAR
jgi:hypothetical protein